MELRWTEEAAADLERIADYLFEQMPGRAIDLIHILYESPYSLLSFPQRGRLGKKNGTRELVLTRLPYVLTYRVIDETIILLRILHGAQKWP